MYRYMIYPMLFITEGKIGVRRREKIHAVAVDAKHNRKTKFLNLKLRMYEADLYVSNFGEEITLS